MNKPGGKHFIGIILAISFAATLTCYVKAEAQWEAEWQKTLEAGKKEGKVSVYVTSMAPAMRKQTLIFKKQFGIDLEITSGRGPELSSRLRTAIRAGLNPADVVIAGGAPVLSFKQMGLTGPLEEKLILPEITDPKLYYTQTHLPWLDEGKHFFHMYAYPNRDITINTDFIKPGEIQSWQDFLKPKYKGKIVWSDPSIDGSGFSGFSTNIRNKVTDENYYRQLVATQDIALSRNQRQMAEWVARGKYAVAVSVPGGALAPLFDAGAHIAHVIVKEGT
ncbi:MAG: extracellular solute-binding protein [Desulfobacterales bacterium]|nr:extracellular solute-binding protein [Desulfobacterales bacterium]